MAGDGINAADLMADERVPASLGESIARQRSYDDLTALRVKNPFLPVMPLPRWNRLVSPTAPNFVESVKVPAGAQLMMFTAPAGVPFFVGTRGGVVFPIVEDGVVDNYADPLVSPIGIAFYCGNLNDVSIGIPNTGNVVGVSFY